MKLPLDGLRVLEFAAGPPVEWACRMLSDFGAEVIKVERIPKPRTRFAPSRPSGMADVGDAGEEMRHRAFDALNSNKKSMALDMKSPKGREIFRRLAATADVLVEGFRPGVMKRLQADYETLQGINGGLVYCSVTGYGSRSSFDRLVGHDLNYVSLAGIVDLTGAAGGPPVIPGTQVADWGGASQAVIGILLALAGRRERNGQGQHVDISLTDCAFSWLMFLASDYFATGHVPQRGRNVTTGAAPFNNVYRTRDGKYLSIACWEPKFYENLCRALGKAEYIGRQDADGAEREEIARAFADVIRTKTRDEWFALLRDAEVCVAPVYGFEEALASEYAKERRSVLRKEHPVLGTVAQLGVPIRLSRTPGAWRSFPPAYGQDTDGILAELGLAPAEVAALRDERVVA